MVRRPSIKRRDDELATLEKEHVAKDQQLREQAEQKVYDVLTPKQKATLAIDLGLPHWAPHADKEEVPARAKYRISAKTSRNGLYVLPAQGLPAKFRAIAELEPFQNAIKGKRLDYIMIEFERR